MELPKRKHIRLRGYDYAQAGAYFITICTHEKQPLLGNLDGGAFRLSPTGHAVQREIQEIQTRFPHIMADKFCIMPNHVHLILSIQETETLSASLFDAVQAIKSRSTIQANKVEGTPGRKIWQGRYFDRVIRNEREYQSFWKYIDENQLKAEVKYLDAVRP